MIVDKDLVRINTNWLPLLDLIRTIEEMKETNSIFDKNL